MQPLTEAKIELRACQLAFQQLGVLNLKLNVRGNTGYPDRLFFIPGGRPLLIEFKRPGEQPTPKQLHIHQQLRNLGYQVEIHDHADRAFRNIAAAMATARLSKEGCEIFARACRRGTFPRPRTRKNR